MGDLIEIACLCGKTRETVQLRATIPVKIKLCHCNSCRRANGTLCSPSLLLATRPACVSDLRSYKVSATTTRFFCSLCGTNICRYSSDSDSWHLRSGVVQRIIGDEQVFSKLEEIVQHQFVGDTKDGGLASCLTNAENEPIRQSRQHADQQSLDSSQEVLPKWSDRSSLEAACHCGSVRFLITRPNEASKRCSSPWPDLIRPYHSQSSKNEDDQKWWLRGRGKYLAGTCACRSCRLAFASPITCWAFIPKANLFRPDGRSFEFDIAELASYESSKGTYRNFCRSCGTPMFWHNGERPDLIDVSVGIFRAEEGARAESWLEWWTERVSFIEDAFEKELVTTFASRLPRVKQNA